MLAAWIRAALWRAESWPAALLNLGTLPTSRTPARLYELAIATEYSDPDRGRALALFIEAWRGGHAEAYAQARRLATELRAFMTLAAVAEGEGDRMTAGLAFLDGGMPHRAIEPLEKAGAKDLVALARGARFDATAAIGAAMEQGNHAHATRIARLAKLDDRVLVIAQAAARAAPEADDAARLLETALLERGDAVGLAEHYRRRFEAAPNKAAAVARMCGAARDLLARDAQPGLAQRLLRLALDTAYEALLAEVPSHVALWEQLVTHARAQGTTRDLLPLIVRALAAPLAPDDMVYLTALGLAITWRDVGDTLAAQPYAATLLDFVPDHPVARALALELGAEIEAPEPAPVKVVTPAAPKIRYADDTQVRRSGPMAAVKPAHEVSSRLALLAPPPPRTTTLKRDVSPIPAEPRAKTPTAVPRAPRVVVPVDAVIELPNGSFFSTVLRDFSTTGAFVVTKRKLDIGSIVTLELTIPEPRSLRQHRHQASARIARQDELGYGLAFLDPTPALVDALRAASE